MDFRSIGDGRSIQRPVLDEELERRELSLRGEFYIFDTFGYGASPGVTGEGSVMQSRLSGMDMTRVHLRPLILRDVCLEDVDISNSTLQDVEVQRVEILRSRAMGVRLILNQIVDLYVDGVRFDYGEIRFGHVKRLAVFRDCSFRETEFSGDLSNVVFDGCQFPGAEFGIDRASGTDFRSSVLAGARGLLTLRGARITRDQAVSVADQLATESGLSVVD